MVLATAELAMLNLYPCLDAEGRGNVSAKELLFLEKDIAKRERIQTELRNIYEHGRVQEPLPRDAERVLTLGSWMAQNVWMTESTTGRKRMLEGTNTRSASTPARVARGRHAGDLGPSRPPTMCNAPPLRKRLGSPAAGGRPSALQIREAAGARPASALQVPRSLAATWNQADPTSGSRSASKLGLAASRGYERDAAQVVREGGEALMGEWSGCRTGSSGGNEFGASGLKMEAAPGPEIGTRPSEKRLLARR
mmetsp:Transcript_44532/g.141880  ORF Transcript_44532/g.141880 Transcript_44532/m.141880 type:complete len:252 (-) Transcript_44532:205-960(-)